MAVNDTGRVSDPLHKPVPAAPLKNQSADLALPSRKKTNRGSTLKPSGMNTGFPCPGPVNPSIRVIT